LLIAANPRNPLVRLLFAAAIFHISVSFIVFLVGKTQLLPRTFDQYGTGTSFVIDSVTYRQEGVTMAALLQEGRLREWITHKSPVLSKFHLRLYSIALALFGAVLGYGVLAVEPVNLAYYLLIIFLTFRIGLALFSAWVGQLAAIVVGVWPSLLMHTTQMMRDPLFLSAFLLLVYCLLRCLQEELPPYKAILSGIGAVGALCLILLSKANVWEVILSVLALWAVGCIVVQLRLHAFHWPRFVLVLLVILSAIVLPRVVPHFRLPDGPRVSSGGLKPIERNTGSANPWTRLVARVGSTRHGFIVRYPNAGSNVDSNVELNGTVDLIKYLPRAAEIGFLAPFPVMWFTVGAKVCLGGRLIAGIEMVVGYFCLLAVGVTLVHNRKRLEVWFLFASAAVGCLALGYVVINIAALYRMRYAYFVLLIVLAARGVQIVRGMLEARTAQALPVPVTGSFWTHLSSLARIFNSFTSARVRSIRFLLNHKCAASSE
jgi:hypothetical protein